MGMEAAQTMWMRLVRKRPLSPRGERRRSLADHAQIVCWSLLFFLMTSPFTFILMGGDPVGDAQRDLATNRREEGSQIFIYGLRYLVLAVAIFLALQRFRRIGRTLPRIWLMAPYLVWATLSFAWSDEPASTLHGVLALFPLLVIGFLAASRMPAEDYARAMLLAGMAMALSSFAFIALFPVQGVHQANDASQAIHAGAWRGVYMHKNHLGQIAALFASGVLFADRGILQPWLKWGLFTMLIALVVGSTSATALVIVPVAVLFTLMAVCLTPLERIFAIVYTALLGSSALLAANVLLNMLGRDLTLSGRTSIWEIAANFIMAQPVQGYGYLSTSYGGFSYMVFKAVHVYDPHNGYLDTLLGVGVVGFLALFGPSLLALVAARGQFLVKGSRGSAATVLTAMMSAWLIGCLTESNARPLGAVTAMGVMAMCLLLAGRVPGTSRRSVRHVLPFAMSHLVPGDEDDEDYNEDAAGWMEESALFASAPPAPADR